jgi:hypothetical protein
MCEPIIAFLDPNYKDGSAFKKSLTDRVADVKEKYDADHNKFEKKIDF